ncbi:MAG: integrin alpha, partial [Paracoccaceae bacterium]
MSLDLSNISSIGGFRIDGEASWDESGASVSGVGDVNGDGFADVIVGAPGHDGYGRNSGEAYVVFGGTGGFPSELDPSALDGANGFRIEGGAPYARAGISVSSAGDLNGDGIDDLVVGARGSTYYGVAGAAYVVFGSTDGFAASLSGASLDGTNGFRL